MISCATVSKAAIRSHYDVATPFYRLLWGPHVHHGLWDDQADPRLSARAAQERLIDTVARAADIQASDRVLDVGCGMGGSSVYLARARGCDVTGITISPVQTTWASWGAGWHGVRSRCRFICGDVELTSFPAAGFDVLWSIECTEHLVDKAAFFQRAAHWLAAGGRVAICAWLAAEDADRPDKRRQVEQVCESFLCPSLGSFSDYAGWMTAAGLTVDATHDWTAAVMQTWEICMRRVRRLGLGRLAGWIDPAQADFLRHFPTLLSAYENGAMRYGCLLAHRPAAP